MVIVEVLVQKYQAAMLRVQSAISYDLSQSAIRDAATRDRLKHHRVGIDGQKSDLAAVVHLLVDKGVFTKEEYLEGILAGAEREADFQVKLTKEKYGLPESVDFG